jgi:hypothetical protein
MDVNDHKQFPNPATMLSPDLPYFSKTSPRGQKTIPVCFLTGAAQTVPALTSDYNGWSRTQHRVFASQRLFPRARGAGRSRELDYVHLVETHFDAPLSVVSAGESKGIAELDQHVQRHPQAKQILVPRAPPVTVRVASPFPADCGPPPRRPGPRSTGASQRPHRGRSPRRFPDHPDRPDRNRATGACVR